MFNSKLIRAVGYALVWLALVGCSTPAAESNLTSPLSSPTTLLEKKAKNFATPIGGPAQAKIEVSQMLDKMAEAFLDQDRAAYIGYGFSPENPSLIEKHNTMLLQAKNVPFAAYDIELTNADEGGLGWFKERAVWVWNNLTVDVYYTLEGVPDTVFSEHATCSFIKSESDDLPAWQLLTMKRLQEPFWLQDEVEVVRSPHFLIFYHPSGQEQVAQIQAEVEAAYTNMHKIPEQTLPVYVVYLAEDSAEISRLMAHNAPPHIMGVALASIRLTSKGFTIDSPAFYLHRRNLLAHSTKDWSKTIRHELVHLVLTKWTLPYVPPWVVEGTATYFSEDDLWPTVTSWSQKGQLTQLSLQKMTAQVSLGVDGPINQQPSLEYSYAYMVTRYLIETYGEETYLAFYRSFGEIPLIKLHTASPITEDYDATIMAWQKWATERQVKQFFKLSIDELEQRAEAWVETKIK